MSVEPEERHREHPRHRFAAPEKLFNLNEIERHIQNEPLSEPHLRQGHRQFTLMQRGPLTMTYYSFEEGGYLVEHQMKGLSSLHVLSGQIGVETDHSQQILDAGEVLMLESDVAHAVHAYEDSRVLVTLCRE